jgi:two-component system, NtrC family, nitrogen regulation sensor histidine kinase NtrY
MLNQFRTQFITAITGLLFIIISLISDTWLHPAFYSQYTKGRVFTVQKKLVEKENVAVKFLNTVAAIPVNKLQESFISLYNQSKEKHILLYILRFDGGIVYYSTNSVFPSKILAAPSDSALQRLANGYYLQKNISANGLIYISLIPVQYQYPFENEYLHNFIPFLKDNNDFKISKNKAEGFSVFSSTHQYLFSLIPQKTVEPFDWVAFLFLAGFTLLFIVSNQVSSVLLKKYRLIPASVVFLLVNALFIFFWKILRLPDDVRLPEDLFRWPVFSPHYYGSNTFFSSLGDLLIFSVLSLNFILFFIKIRIRTLISPFFRMVLIFALATVLYLISAEIVNLVKSLILDSIIPFDFGNIFSLSFYSLVGIMIIFIAIGSYFICLQFFARWFLSHIRNNRQIFSLLSLCILVAGAILWFTPVPFYIGFLFNTICILLYYFRRRIFQKNKTVFIASLLATASLFLSIILSNYYAQKQKDEQGELASKVITERDPVAEYLFTSVYDDIQDDNLIKDYFRYPLITETVMQNRLQQVYLSGYFSKYDIDISTFSPDSLPYKNPLEKPLSFYSNQLDKEGAPELPDNLYYLHRHTGLPTYISKIPILEDGRTLGIILLQMQQKPFYEESVYPELLVSENMRKFKELDKYSYAVYSNGVLLNQKGEYPYPGFLTFKVDTGNYSEFKEGGYLHLVHPPHANLLVIVSAKTPDILYYLSSFAFVFLFLGISYLVALYVPLLFRIVWLMLKGKSYFLQNRFSFKMLSLRNKILITVISGMTISMLLIGMVTVSYIIYQYNKDELDKLRKKTRLITTRLSNDLQQNERQLVYQGSDIRLMVKTLSEIYQADINVFDVKGNLITSTENAIYDKQLIAPKMDAFANLKFNSQSVSQVIQEEHIGRLKFTSCYMPIRNSFGQVTGYLNLPYFSKEQELKNRISSFLEALVNLYLLLFLILVMLGLFMARVVTSPLNIIRNHLRKTSLSGDNEFISWTTNDEIGKLVNEYNSMILALKESAERLSQSERENALKELAQHVAHEIKNPLTPMKLGIQQLQNAWYAKSPDYDVLFKKVTTMIIKQIDTLSAIATDFNDSAKQGNPQSVNINNLLVQVCDLFGHNLSVHTRLDIDNRKDIRVFADPNKLIRVFTNLVNNAIQSIPEGRQGNVTIRSVAENDTVIITIEDNGSGIPEAFRRKIFIPNFSTKSSGTGLGLAISKAIIEQAGGTVSFTSVLDKGSVFTVALPVYDQQSAIISKEI